MSDRCKVTGRAGQGGDTPGARRGLLGSPKLCPSRSGLPAAQPGCASECKLKTNASHQQIGPPDRRYILPTCNGPGLGRDTPRSLGKHAIAAPRSQPTESGSLFSPARKGVDGGGGFEVTHKSRAKRKGGGVIHVAALFRSQLLRVSPFVHAPTHPSDGSSTLQASRNTRAAGRGVQPRVVLFVGGGEGGGWGVIFDHMHLSGCLISCFVVGRSGDKFPKHSP